MRTLRLALAAIFTAALAAGGCSEEPDPNVLDVTATDFPPHSTAARIAAQSTIRVGITGAQLDVDGAPAGFEVELAAVIAGALGIERHAITWIQVEPGHHERLIEDRHVDVLVAGMAVTGDRLQIVDVAGPYHHGGLAVLTSTGSAAQEQEQLTELTERAVCAADDVAVDAAVADATDPAEPLGEILARASRAPVPDCLDRLDAGEVEVVLGPDLVLAGHAATDAPNGTETPQTPYDIVALDEPRLDYVVGLAQGDGEFRGIVADALKAAAADGRWAAAWEQTMAPVLGQAVPPTVDRS